MGLIPFFIPHVGCPQLCIFCNQPRISGHEGFPSIEGMDELIREYIGTHREDKQWEVAFYGGSFTAIPIEVQDRLLAAATKSFKEGSLDGIRISTRPDAITRERLIQLYDAGVRTIELGVQTLNDEMLERAKRGHTSEDVQQAVELIRELPFTLGLQILVGLPGESWQTIVHTAVGIRKLQPDLLRIYPTLVFENTDLGDMFQAGEYKPLGIEEAIKYGAFIKTYVEEAHIEVIRTGLQATPDLDRGIGLLGGPYEPAMGELVVNEQYKQWLENIIFQHRLHFGSIESIDISYPQSMTSKLRGHKQRNVEYFAKVYKNIIFTWHEGKYLQVVLDGMTYV